MNCQTLFLKQEGGYIPMESCKKTQENTPQSATANVCVVVLKNLKNVAVDNGQVKNKNEEQE